MHFAEQEDCLVCIFSVPNALAEMKKHNNNKSNVDTYKQTNAEWETESMW